MNRCILLIPVVIFFLSACSKQNPKIRTTLAISSDTTILYFEPSLIVRTIQYLKEDSLNLMLVKEEFYSDSLLLKEIYCNNYMSSEYDGTTDAEYLYYYNKNKQLVLKYCVESFWEGDTIKYQYQYYNGNTNCNILVSDCRRRLKNDSISHRCIVSDDNYTEERVWKYMTTITKKYQEGRLIEQLEPIEREYNRKQNRYTYEYDGDKLLKKMSFLDNKIPYWTESIEYKKDTIKTTHVNHDSFPIPFYTEIQTLDTNGNVILLEKYDNNNLLMRRYRYTFDIDGRLVKMQCFNGKDELKVTHIITYKSIR